MIWFDWHWNWGWDWEELRGLLDYLLGYLHRIYEMIRGSVLHDLSNDLLDDLNTEWPDIIHYSNVITLLHFNGFNFLRICAIERRKY